MTIRKGEPWGMAITVPDDVLVISSNLELSAALRNGPPERVIGVAGGDLGRSLGSNGRVPVSGEPGIGFPLDLIRIDSGDDTTWAAAHVLIRRSWWRGAIAAVMNAQFLGAWDIAPRSHPNDGRFELVEVGEAMPFSDRWKARRRLPLGTYIPHPDIRLRQLTESTVRVPPGTHVRVDGQLWAGARSELRCVVLPDALTAIIAAA